MNWYKIAYNEPIGYLNKYLRKGFDPWDYMYLVPSFLDQAEDPLMNELYENQATNKSNLFNEENLFYTNPDYFAEKWLSQASSKEIEEFREYVKKRNLDASRSTAPPYESVDYKKFIKPTWLVHFTNDPNSISEEGFTKGWEGIEGLAYTSYYNRGNNPGYNFAFRADNYRDIKTTARGGKYGKHAVLFLGSGVEATHYGDNEDQVIVWGPSVNTNMIVPIYKLSNGSWGIEREGVRDSYPLIQSEDITDVIEWAINNVDMVRRILGKWKPKRKKPKRDNYSY